MLAIGFVRYEGHEAGSSISHPLSTHIHLHAPRSTTVRRKASVGARGLVNCAGWKNYRTAWRDGRFAGLLKFLRMEKSGSDGDATTKCGVDACAPMVRYRGRVRRRVSAHNTRITKVDHC
jgi:hypothetical protein